MSSQKAATYRRRAISASTRTFASLTAWNHSKKIASLKRNSGLSRSSSNLKDRTRRGRSDVGGRRRGQMRKRELSICSDGGPIMSQTYLRSSHSMFATTSDDFNLPLSQGYHRNLTRRSSTQSSRSSYADVSDTDNMEDLCKMRSTAFWDLQRTVAESGEGFVHRMREHEHQRSKRAIGERGRLRGHSVSSPPSSQNCSWPNRFVLSDGEEDEEEDIQIYSGEPHLASPPPLQLDVAMALDCALSNNDSSTTSQSTSPYGFPSLSMENSDSQTNNTFHSHPPLSQSPTSRCRILHMDPADSEETLAAITLAFANGAGSINDYSSISRHANHPYEHLDIGDLWH